MLRIAPQYQDLVNQVLQTASAQIQAIIHEPVSIVVLEPENKKFPLESIMWIVCQELNVTEEEIKGDNRKERIKDARHIACYLSQKTGCYSLKKIATWLNYDDHTPVIHACKRIQDMIDTNDEIIVTKLNKCRIALFKIEPDNLNHP